MEVKYHGKKSTSMTMQVTSSAFQAGQAIPAKYTCEGADISPPLEWSGVPASAKSLALICDDPDAPVGTWLHWVLYDLPVTATDLAEKVPPRSHCPLAPNRGSTISNASVTAGRVRHQENRTVITSSFMHSTSIWY